MTKFLGRLSNGASTRYTFKSIPRDRQKLILEFDLYEIDDWEAGNVGDSLADILYISINNMDIPLGSYNSEFDEGYFEKWFGDVKYSSRSYEPPTQLGFGTSLDQRHNVIVEIPNRFITANDTVEIGFRFASQSDEGAGFDNIKLFASCDNPQLAPTSAPTRPNQRRNITTTNPFTPGSTGDPHLKSWTNREYSFNGKCDTVLLSVPDYTPTKELRVHARTDNFNQSYGWNTNLAFQIGSSTFEISTENWKNTTFYLNKTEIGFDRIPSRIEGYPISKVSGKDAAGNPNSATITVSLEWGDVLQFRASGRFGGFTVLRFTNRFLNSVGMIGSYSTGDPLLRNGTVARVNSTNDQFNYGQEWQVSSSEPMIFHNNRAPQAPTNCTKPSPNSRSYMSQDAARQICINANVTITSLAPCQTDVFLTGDPGMVTLYKPVVVTGAPVLPPVSLPPVPVSTPAPE